VKKYLVNKFLDLAKAPRKIVVVANAILTMDALAIVRIILGKYGMTQFLNYLFWIGLFI
jgi:hypothetical protein